MVGTVYGARHRVWVALRSDGTVFTRLCSGARHHVRGTLCGALYKRIF
jgi:hypothetical protein